jgi:peptidoglycan hydrolase CwlO-like protein
MNKEYGITELAKMFNTTRATIYRKLEQEYIKEYVIQTTKGKKLLQEGLSHFQILMAESRVTNNQKKEPSNDFKDEYIDNLKKQVDSLSKDKENLYKEIEEKNNQLNNAYQIINNSQKLLSESNEKIKLLEDKESNNNKNLKDKKTFWNIFKKN